MAHTQRNAAPFGGGTAACLIIFFCLAVVAAQSAAAVDRTLLNHDMMMKKGDGMMMDGNMKMMCPKEMPKYMKPTVYPMGMFKKTMGSDLTSTLSVMGNGANGNMAKALMTADLAQIIFTLKAGFQFAPHYHPNASELWTVTEGTFTAFVLLNDKLYVYEKLMPGQSVVFPKNRLHGFFNSGNTQGVASAVFNSAMPGAMFYEDLAPCAPGLAKGMPTKMELLNLIKHTKAYDTPDKIKNGSPFFKLAM